MEGQTPLRAVEGCQDHFVLAGGREAEVDDGIVSQCQQLPRPAPLVFQSGRDGWQLSIEEDAGARAVALRQATVTGVVKQRFLAPTHFR